MHQTFFYILPFIFIVIFVNTPFDSIPLQHVWRDPSDGSHPKQSLLSIGSIIVLIVTLIWGRSRRWTIKDWLMVKIRINRNPRCNNQPVMGAATVNEGATVAGAVAGAVAAVVTA
jgi:hypothetical protein